MKLSIIVPVYNSEQYLEGCVQSLFDQYISKNDFEIILVNDGSTDNSLELCYELSKKHKNIKVISQKNKGQSAARNVGISHAKGKYIYFIDSDDHLKSGYLNLFLNILEEKKLDFLGFKNYNTSKTYVRSSNVDCLEIETEGSGQHIIAEHQYYNGPCWYIFEKKIAKELYFEEGRVCEDVIFTTMLLLRVKNGRVYNNKIYGYYTNNESTLRTKDPKRFHKTISDMFYVAERFSEIISHIDFQTNEKIFTKLKKRQESYTYFAIIRFLKSRRKYSELDKYLSVLKESKYSGYPIRNFKGYNTLDRLLIIFFNNRLSLQMVTWVGKFFTI